MTVPNSAWRIAIHSLSVDALHHLGLRWSPQYLGDLPRSGEISARWLRFLGDDAQFDCVAVAPCLPRARGADRGVEELRSSLLSSVSHDLRTPLAAITGAATALRDRGAELVPAQRAELVGAICDEAERLERLVGNLLDMSRLQGGSLEVKREWVPLEEIIGAALTQMERPLGTRPVHVSIPKGLPLVPVDPVLLEQVFCNLLENAARYTPEGTAVRIAATAVGQTVEVTVDDEGPGLDPGSEQRVFEKFYRGKVSTPGAGLGLAICRGIIVAHQGQLTASRSPNGGARFTAVLPLIGQPPTILEEGQEQAT